MNSRERFLAVLHGDRPDHPPLFPEGIREEVLLSWRSQGLPGDIALEDLFPYDPFEELDPDVYPISEIGDWATPQRLLPILCQRLDPEDPRRLPDGWRELVKGWRDRQHPLFLRIHQGLFLSLGIGEWRSFAPALLRLVDQPDFVRQILAIQADFAARLAEKILRQVDLDGVIFSEPVAGNHGSLVSAEMYRDFALQSYAPIFDIIREYQVPAIIWRSYANPANLLPEVVKYPFNVLWLCETPPGELTPAQVRHFVGSNMTLIGGIDSDVLRQDTRAIQQAVAALQPFVEAGYFIPLADGRVREDVPYPNYAFYRQELHRVFVPTAGKSTPSNYGADMNPILRYIQIPQVGKPVSVLGLGTATSVFTPGSYDQAAELIARFLEAGGNCIDTAHIYGFGDSEKTLGRWFQETGRRGGVVLITKGCHPAVDRQNVLGGPWEPRLTPEAIRQDLGESLERLQTDYIDLYLLHRDDEAAPVGPLVEALNQEQRRGRIRAFGVSNWRVERIAESDSYAAGHGLNGVAASSPQLSLARPRKMLFPGTRFADEGARQWHRDHQLPLLAWSALAGGFLSGRYTTDTPAGEDITQVYYTAENFERLRRAQILASRKNATLAQIALAYVLGQPFPVVALAGPTTVSHLESVLAALEIELSLEELDFLEG